MSDLDRVKVHLKSIGASYIALYHQTGDHNAKLGKRKKRKLNGGSAMIVHGNKSMMIFDSMDSSGEVTPGEPNHLQLWYWDTQGKCK
jgi:hypothetical protein